MPYWKKIEDGYITVIGTGAGGAAISAEEYGAILDVIRQQPTPPEGYGYRLREDLSWEAYALPPVEEEENPTLSDSAALAVITGERE